MTGNIKDVLASPQIPVNPYKNNDNKSAKEAFSALLASSQGNLPNMNTVNTPDFDGNNALNKSDALSFSTEDSVKGNAIRDRIIAEPNDSLNSIDMDKVSEAISSFEEEVRSVITEELDISEEELNNAMEELGLTFIDLTEPKNLAMLMNTLNPEKDNISLLLDTGVKDIFDSMGELTGELFAETGLDTEGLISVMEMEPVTEGDVQEFSELVSETVVNPEAETIVSDNTSDEISPVDKKDITPIAKPMEEPKEKSVSETKESSESEDTSAVDALRGKVTQSKGEGSSNNGAGNGSNGNSGNGSQTAMAGQTTQTTQTVNENLLNTDSPRDFNAALNEVETPVEVPTYTSVDTADVINQIVTGATTTITNDVRSMELELNPLNLGRMIMQVSESEGQVTAKLITQNENVKSALEIAITSLIEKLNSQGIKVDAVEVSVGTHEFEENLEQNFAGEAREDLNESRDGNEDNRSRGGIHLGDPNYMEGAELTEEEELTASIMRTYGNTVNFTA